MSDGLNRVILLGNLGATPELRYTSAGQPVLNMRLATSETFLDRDKVRQTRTDWHSCTMWGPRGEALSKLLKQGDRILVEGSLRTSTYDKNGEKRYRTEVNVKELCFGGSKGQRDDAPGDEHDPRRAHEDGDYDGGQPPGTPHRTPPRDGGYGGARQPAGGRQQAAPARDKASDVAAESGYDAPPDSGIPF